MPEFPKKAWVAWPPFNRNPLGQCMNVNRFVADYSFDDAVCVVPETELAAKDARIASLEFALGKIETRTECYVNCGEDSEGEHPHAMLHHMARQALSQPALAQAAEKWKRMEAVVQALRDYIGFVNDEERQSEFDGFPSPWDKLGLALHALDACEILKGETK